MEGGVRAGKERIRMKSKVSIPRVSPGRAAQFAIDLFVLAAVFILAYLLPGSTVSFRPAG